MKSHVTNRPLITCISSEANSGSGQRVKHITKKSMVCMNRQKVRIFSYLGMMIWR